MAFVVWGMANVEVVVLRTSYRAIEKARMLRGLITASIRVWGGLYLYIV